MLGKLSSSPQGMSRLVSTAEECTQQMIVMRTVATDVCSCLRRSVKKKMTAGVFATNNGMVQNLPCWMASYLLRPPQQRKVKLDTLFWRLLHFCVIHQSRFCTMQVTHSFNVYCAQHCISFLWKTFHGLEW